MNDPRQAEATLATLLELAESDPRRAEMLRDPAVRALYDNYRAFLDDDGDHVPGTDRADTTLSAWREREIEAVRAAPAEPGSPSWTSLFAPALRPAWGLAAVVVVAATWFVLRPDAPRPTVLRGATSAEVALLAPSAAAAGTRLAWHRYAEADAYTVVLYAPGLVQVRALPETADTTVLISQAELAALPAGLLYRVVARSMGDELAHSGLATMPR